jgi:hypothetical protein
MLSNHVLMLLRQQLRAAAHYSEQSHATLPIRTSLAEERTIRRWLRSQGLRVHVGMSAAQGRFCRALVFQVPKAN